MVTAKPGYGYVELSWSNTPPDAVMYRISRRSTGSFEVIDTIPGTFHIDATVQGGTVYEYVVAAKTPELGEDSSPVSVTPSATLPPEKPMSALRDAVASSGQVADIPPGIYRIAKDGNPSFTKPQTIRSANRDVWLLCSRDWGAAREAGNTWTQVGSYWRSSRQAPRLQPNGEDPAHVSNGTLARFYNNVTCWNDKAQQQWLTPLGAGGTPQGNQVCYESEADRRLRIGVDPSKWQRIEVTEALGWGGISSHDLTFEGITFRGAGGGSSDAALDIRSKRGIKLRNCVIGNTHAGGVTMWQGETSTNVGVFIEGCWFDHCGYSALSASSIRGITVRNCLFTDTGGQGYNEIWHGGDFKFVGNAVGILIEYSTSYRCTGASWWADISAAEYEIRYTKCAHNKNFYCFSHEISLSGNVHHNLFWDGGRTKGYPTAHTDQGNTLNFHDNTVVGASGNDGANDGKVFQFQGGTGPETFRPDLPPGGCKDNSITNNWFIHVGKDCFDWSMQAQGRFRFDGNKWWSANPLWKFDTYNNNIRDINTWNGLPDVGTDTFASVEDKDRQLKFWGILADAS